MNRLLSLVDHTENYDADRIGRVSEGRNNFGSLNYISGSFGDGVDIGSIR